MDDLVRFLRGCLDDDERSARATPERCWSASRLLAQVYATRLLLDASNAACGAGCPTEHTFTGSCSLRWMGPVHEADGRRWLHDDTGARFAPPPVTSEWSLRVLALPYAGHPGYRDEWRP
ncbi:DUF6221 family protein [Streptomyces sp. NPDC093225]|uniref:DUF6221 family protein n=1 Tax=Streptomyces sp. NPDC093225 TaxID=3366034 RepID=UPI0037F220F9